ncbi:MAG: FGGY-family carbohydrate kinase [Cyanobacterium sp. T60_A2020_053]|nr:FGGY-family carbohydrate kinase [Cyanobacterium sp. T60_A2020_053]
MSDFYLGMDFGTSGARALVIDESLGIVYQKKVNPVNYSAPHHWQEVLFSLLNDIPLMIKQHLGAIAINGTSSTMILCDQWGNPLDSPLWYNDNRGQIYLDELRHFVPKNHLVLSATSSLSKVYWWYKKGLTNNAKYVLNQADWLGFLLHNQLGISDYHNILKLGYDVENLIYPNWLQNLPFFDLFPQVKSPGEVVDLISPNIAKNYQINPQCVVKTGTTDSIGAFIASGASQAGIGVTSLGSTLVIKLLSTTKIDHFPSGIYSHRFGDLWLVGGASNSGGAVLKYYFSDQELQELSLQINPSQFTNFNYYPLLKKGERFPINDVNLEPKLTPKPDNKVLFLQGLLEGIADIENRGYQLLETMGATPVTQVYTAGGGAKNAVWTTIRQGKLKLPIMTAHQTESAYGGALLALGR